MNIAAAQQRVTGGRWGRIVLGDVLAEHVVELRGRARVWPWRKREFCGRAAAHRCVGRCHRARLGKRAVEPYILWVGKCRGAARQRPLPPRPPRPSLALTLTLEQAAAPRSDLAAARQAVSLRRRLRLLLLLAAGALYLLWLYLLWLLLLAAGTLYLLWLYFRWLYLL